MGLNSGVSPTIAVTYVILSGSSRLRSSRYIFSINPSYLVASLIPFLNFGLMGWQKFRRAMCLSV